MERLISLMIYRSGFKFRNNNESIISRVRVRQEEQERKKWYGGLFANMEDGVEEDNGEVLLENVFEEDIE